MKTWIRRTLLAVFGASIALGGLAACGHRHEHHGSGTSLEDRAKFREKMIQRASAKLDLNADQRQRLGVLFDKLAAQRTVLMGATDPRAQVLSLVSGDKFDRAKAQALVSEKTAAIAAGSPEVVAALGDFYDSLNPQQQAQVREYMERRGHRRWRS